MLAAPYMYSGTLAPRPVAAATYQYASSMLPQSAPAQPVAPLPSIAQIQQAFHDARQQASRHVEADFSYAVVTAMRERMIQDAMQRENVGEPDVPGSVQQDDSSDEGIPGAAPAQSPSEDSSVGDSSGVSHPAGTGASWQQDQPSGLRASLRNTWGRAMSAARAANQPISFFFQGGREQPQAHAEDSTDLLSRRPYSPFPVITTEPFSRAWRETHQQAASIAEKLTSSAQSAAGRALNSLQTAATSPSTALRHGWEVVSHRLSQRKIDAGSLASSLAGAADSLGAERIFATQLSSVSDSKVTTSAFTCEFTRIAVSARLARFMHGRLFQGCSPRSVKIRTLRSFTDIVQPSKGQEQHARQLGLTLHPSWPDAASIECHRTQQANLGKMHANPSLSWQHQVLRSVIERL